ncbi:MAG: hypothetical protein O3C40_30610 [Planctomycetota bacterium]|nr:hypothetical protein [Planctomycetota bacterium]
MQIRTSVTMHQEVCTDGYAWLQVASEEGHEFEILVPKPFAANPPAMAITPDFYRDMPREPALFKVFADLQPTHEAIIEFADIYGSLCGNAFTGRSGKVDFAGDPFVVWRYHILTMRHWLTIWDLVSEGNKERLLTYAQSKPSFGVELRVDVIEKNSMEAYDRHRFGVARIIEAPRKQCLMVARKQVWDAVEEHLFTSQFLEANDDLFVFLFGLQYDTGNEVGEFTLQKRGEGLLPYLWLQFADSLVENKRYRRCSTCNKPFELVPDIARTNKLFCKDACKLKAYRSRKRKAREMRGQGKTLQEIARHFGSDFKTVKGWVEGTSRKHGEQ